MNKYNNFTVEETNLLSIYMTGSKEGLVVAMNAALRATAFTFLPRD